MNFLTKIYESLNESDLPLTYVLRGLLYGITSLVALYAGFKIASPTFLSADFVLLAIPVPMSVFFFMCYSAHFPVPELDSPTVDEETRRRESDIRRRFRRAAVYAYAFVSILLTVIVVFFARYLGLNLFSWLTVLIGIQCLVYFGYGIYLWIQFSRDSDLPVRHQLGWPVVFSIGFSLYNGLVNSIEEPTSSLLLPVFLIILFFLTTTIIKLSQKAFLLLLLVSAIVVGFFSWYRLEGYGLYAMLTMAFCVVVSAYLAVFEAWKITSWMSNDQGRTSVYKVKRYSQATLWASAASIWILPFFFVPSTYGLLFFVTFAVHALFTYVWWWWFSGDYGSLRDRSWGFHNFWAGTSFLAILILGAIFPFQPVNLVVSPSVQGIGGSLVAGATIVAIGLLTHDRIKNRNTSRLEFIYDSKNTHRFLVVLSTVGAIGCYLYADQFPADDPKNPKGHYAFIFYGVTVLVCFILESIQYFNAGGGPTKIVTLLSKFVMLVRAATSILIGLIVFIPAIGHGYDWTYSLGLSAPFVFAAMGGFALNDYFDYRKDMITKPYRPIPSGVFSRAAVLLLAVTMLVLAAISSFVMATSRIDLGLYLGCLVGVALYNVFVKHLSLSKTFLTSIVSALPVCFSVISFDYSTVFFVLPVATSLFVLGREWLMDVRDVEGDSAEGTVTIPAILGSKWTLRLAVTFQFVAAISLFPIAVELTTLTAFGLITSIFAMILVLTPFWFIDSGAYRIKVAHLMRIPMFLAILLFIC